MFIVGLVEKMVLLEDVKVMSGESVVVVVVVVEMVEQLSVVIVLLVLRESEYFEVCSQIDLERSSSVLTNDWVEKVEIVEVAGVGR